MPSPNTLPKVRRVHRVVTPEMKWQTRIDRESRKAARMGIGVAPGWAHVPH